MLLLRTSKLPEGAAWQYELKYDGFRALGIKAGGTARLVSRNDNDFSRRYPAVTEALRQLPDDTVIDGELVALDEFGRPSFNALQKYGSSTGPLLYFVFDVLILAGTDVTGEPLTNRRELLEGGVLAMLDERSANLRCWKRAYPISSTQCGRRV